MTGVRRRGCSRGREPTQVAHSGAGIKKEGPPRVSRGGPALISDQSSQFRNGREVLRDGGRGVVPVGP